MHFRNIEGGYLNFRETFIDNGSVDMLQAARTYKEIGYDGMLMPDHVPNVDGDPDHIAGIRVRARLHQGDHRGGECRSIKTKNENEKRKTKNEERRTRTEGGRVTMGPALLCLNATTQSAEKTGLQACHS